MSKTTVELSLTGIVDLNDDVETEQAMEEIADRARQVLLDKRVFLSIEEEAISVERYYDGECDDIEEDEDY